MGDAFSTQQLSTEENIPTTNILQNTLNSVSSWIGVRYFLLVSHNVEGEELKKGKNLHFVYCHDSNDLRLYYSHLSENNFIFLNHIFH